MGVFKGLILGAGIVLGSVMVPVDAVAQNLGIDFAKMPVGTKMTYQASSGASWTAVYRGKRGRSHVIREEGRNAEGKRFGRTVYYDKHGRMTSYSYKDANRPEPGKVVFKPFSCDYAVGTCKHQRKLIVHNFINNGASRNATYVTRKKGKHYTVGVDRGDRNGKVFYNFELGPYNLKSRIYWGAKGQFFQKLVKVE